MVEQNSRLGTNGSNGHHAIDGANLAHDAEMAWREAQGATRSVHSNTFRPWGSVSTGTQVC